MKNPATVHLKALVSRNIKIYFKDKSTFLTSLITPLILFVLFVTFLKGVYEENLVSLLNGAEIDKKIIDAFAGGWLMSSTLGVSAVTVAFCSNMLMASDKINGSIGDLTVAPVKKSTLALSYFLANLLTTAIVCYVVMCVGFVYLAAVGWFFTAADVLLIVADTAVCILFGASLAALVDGFISTQGGISAVATLVSSLYGFICGAYMPISQFAAPVRNFISLLPGTYGAGLLRNHFLGAPLRELGKTFPAEAIKGLRDGFDANMYFFGHAVPLWAMYLIVGMTAVLVLLLYVFITKRRAKKS